MRQNVSPTAAALVLLVAVVVFAALFSRPEMAPEGVGVHSHGESEVEAPPEPYQDEQELVSVRRGLRHFGAGTVLPPLMSDRRKGARISYVVPNSIADKAGLKPGDLVTSMNGQSVMHPIMLVGAIERVPEDRPSVMVVERAGKTVTLTVTGLKPVPIEERMQKR